MPRRALLLAVCTLGCLAVRSSRARQPSRIESKAVQWTKRHVTIGGTDEPNPLKATPENIEEGKRIFGYYCVVCHGRDGQNTGVPFAANMSPPIPSLASADIQRYIVGQFKCVIVTGLFRSGMPASTVTLSESTM